MLRALAPMMLCETSEWRESHATDAFDSEFKQLVEMFLGKLTKIGLKKGRRLLMY